MHCVDSQAVSITVSTLLSRSTFRNNLWEAAMWKMTVFSCVVCSRLLSYLECLRPVVCVSCILIASWLESTAPSLRPVWLPLSGPGNLDPWRTWTELTSSGGVMAFECQWQEMISYFNFHGGWHISLCKIISVFYRNSEVPKFML